MTKPIHIYTVVYGGHIDWFYRALVRSLSWPKNKSALVNARWTIYGDLNETQRIYEIATKVIPFHQIEFKQKIMDGANVNLLGSMMQTMRRCLDDKSLLLMAPPDTIFSEGSIDAMMAYAQSPGACVAVPHPRVLPSIINELGDIPPTNAQLVTLALEKHVHDCWKTSELGMNVSGVPVGGICWRRLADKLYAVQHRLPTVYLANFTEDDRKFFSKPWKNVPQQFGMWDHEWPGAELIPKQRLRTIGSSDAAFIIECTESWKNVPTQRLIDPNNPDAFHRDEYHNKINRQYLSCFRGE